MRVSFGLGRQQKKAFLPITLLRLEQVELPADVITVALEALSLQPFETATRGLFVTPDFDMSAARAPAAGKAPAVNKAPAAGNVMVMSHFPQQPPRPQRYALPGCSIHRDGLSDRS
jgi:hypothetical protein